MEVARIHVFAFFWLCEAISIPHAQAQSAGVCIDASLLIRQIRSKHIEPIINDSTFSRRIFKQFFEQLDPNKEFFTKQDIGAHSFRSGDLTQVKLLRECSFVSQMEDLYRQRLLLIKGEIEKATNEQVPYDSKKSFFLVPQQTEWLPDVDHLVIRLKDRLAQQILLQTIKAGQAKDQSIQISRYEFFEATAKTLVLNREHQRIVKLIGDESSVRTAFFRAIASAFDPHTEFFGQLDMEEFNESIDKNKKSIGILFRSNQQGNIVVAKMVPTGPAWKSNRIHLGDELVGFQVDKNGMQDILDLDNDQINALLKAAEHNVTLTLKRQNGQLTTITLEKEIIENDENKVSSFVLTGERKLGYVSLPSFYTNTEDSFQKGCANDIAREIIKLKREKIEGLILDLRFNGGGSMLEAAELAGIFIDHGPLALLQFAGGDIVSLKDTNKGTIYDGPLAIIVNKASASASELVAAALQDYNRAIIVGSATYGKATGQVTMLKSGNAKASDNPEYIKVTMERIYRLSGKSHQNYGISPDIELPDITESLVLAEAASPNSLVNRPISRKVYFTPYDKPQLDSVRHRSTQRIIYSERFNLVREIISRLNKPFALTPASVMELQDFKSLFAEIEKPIEQPRFRVLPVSFEKELLSVSEYQNEITEQNIKEIQNSFYVDEVYKILSDYLDIIGK